MHSRLFCWFVLTIAALLSTAATAPAQDWNQILKGLSQGSNNSNSGQKSNGGSAWGSNNSNRQRNAWGSTNNNRNGFSQQQSTPPRATKRYSPDADDGPSRPSRVTPTPIRPTWPTTPTNTDRRRKDPDLSWIAPLVDSAAKAAAAADANNRRRINNDTYPDRPRYDYRPQPNYVPSNNVPNNNGAYIAGPVQPAAPVKPAVPKKNPKPPEKINAARDNKTPDTKFESIDKKSYALAGDVVAKTANESVDALEKELGDAALDPEVKKILDEGREKIKNGEPLDPDWTSRLQKAAEASNKLPNGVDPAKLDQLAQDVVGLTEANAHLQNPFPNGGFDPTFPTGPTDIVTMPAWSDDECVMLPDGAMMVGTGGQGSISVVSADAADVLGVPVGIGEPEPDSDANFAKRPKSGVLLMNPDESGAAINFTINGAAYTMEPSYTQQLTAGQTWVVRFDRGQGNGEAKYTLSDGTYMFGASDKGWELFRKAFSVTIDNRENDDSFNYNIDNAQQEVAGGEEKTHNSLYPILVRFDRGDDGKEAQKRIVEKAHTLVVAVDPKDGFWELFPADNFAKLAKERHKSEKSTTARSDSKRIGKEKDRSARIKALLELSKS